MVEIEIDEIKTELLGYSDMLVSKAGSTDEVFRIYAKPSLFRADHCPQCMERRLQQRGYQQRKIRDYILVNKKIKLITLMYQRRQYSCVNCAHSFGENFDWLVVSGCCNMISSVSLRLKILIYKLCSMESSWSKVAKQLGLSFETVAKACSEIGALTRMNTHAFKSPLRMAVRKLNLRGKIYSLFADLDHGVICYFSAGSPADILQSSDPELMEIVACLFYEAKLVVVEPDCDYVQALTACIHPTCKIAADQAMLYDQVFDNLKFCAKELLSAYNFRKFSSFVSAAYLMSDQKEYNYINRTLSASDELKKKYYTLSALREILFPNKEYYMGTDELINYLIADGLVTEEMRDKLFDVRTIDDCAGLDDFRAITKYIEDDLLSSPRAMKKESVEDKVFYSVPRTFLVMNDSENKRKGSYYRDSPYSSNCFTETGVCYIGRRFEDIRQSLRDKREVLDGKKEFEDLLLSD